MIIKTNIWIFAVLMAALWLGAWIIIIVLNSIVEKRHLNDFNHDFVKDEIVKDANNLFRTGFFYQIILCLAWLFTIKVVKWILVIIGIGLAVLPMISVIRVLFQWTEGGYDRLRKFTGFLSQVIPLVMSLITLWCIIWQCSVL